MTPPKYIPIEKAALLTADPARFMQLYRSGAIACRVIDGIPCVRVEAVEPFKKREGEQ